MFLHDNLIYHRGRHGNVTRDDNSVIVSENSLQAFRSAIDEKATMVEFDARRNPLGKAHFPIIAHDAASCGETPTIVDVLDAVNARCDVNIEIKDPIIWKQVLELVRWYIEYDGWRPEQFMLSTFHHPTAVLIKKHFPEICVAAIMDAIPLPRYITMLARNGIDNLHVEWMNADMDMQYGSLFMKQARKLGLHVFVFTVNDLSVARRVHDWGAERIFTDRPERFPI